MANKLTQFVISIMSRDRIGIVHEVSSAISELGGDIADLSQTVLRGYFTMILLATFPPTVTVETIKRKLSTVNTQSETSLEVAVKQVIDTSVIDQTAPPEYTYVLTASGQNRIGFVAAVSAFCAGNRINILDLATIVAGETYIMVLLVDLSRCEQMETIHHRLQQFGQEMDLTVALQHHDIFKATNEISML